MLTLSNFVPVILAKRNFSFKILYCYCRMVRDGQVALFLTIVYQLRQRFQAINSMLEDTISSDQYTDARYLLRSLDGSHATLRNCAQILNYHSGLQVLLAMGLTAISDVASFTTRFDYYSNLASISPRMFDGWFMFLKAFYIILFVIVNCDLTEHQAGLTASIVHRVGNTFTAEGLEKQVMISSLHLLHDKVKFAALGLIPLNVTLLAAIGTLAMDPQYLVALGFSLPPSARYKGPGPGHPPPPPLGPHPPLVPPIMLLQQNLTSHTNITGDDETELDIGYLL